MCFYEYVMAITILTYHQQYQQYLAVVKELSLAVVKMLLVRVHVISTEQCMKGMWYTVCTVLIVCTYSVYVVPVCETGTHNAEWVCTTMLCSCTSTHSTASTLPADSPVACGTHSSNYGGLSSPTFSLF